jgi:hypothetical protein
LNEIELEMKRKEEEYRRTIEEDLREREERKARVKLEVQRLLLLNNAAVSLLIPENFSEYLRQKFNQLADDI